MNQHTTIPVTLTGHPRGTSGGPTILGFGVADRLQPHAEIELIEEPIKSWVTVQAGLNSSSRSPDPDETAITRDVIDLRWRKTFLVEVKEKLAQLGLMNCAVCGSEHLRRVGASASALGLQP